MMSDTSADAVHPFLAPALSDCRTTWRAVRTGANREVGEGAAIGMRGAAPNSELIFRQ